MRPSVPPVPDHPDHPAHRDAGFSLIELLVALVVTVMLVLAVLALFDFNSRLTRVQTNVADMQQSLRVAQYDMVRLMRMAGRGGLPAVQNGAAYPVGAAVAVLDNAPAGERLLSSDTETAVAEGTDVLTVRGVFTSQIYQIDKLDLQSFRLTYPGPAPADPDPSIATGGVVEICALTPSGVTQNLQPLIDRITNNQSDALIIVSALNDRDYAVVELDATNSDDEAPSCLPLAGVSLTFQVTTGTHSAEYRALSSTPAGETLPRSLTKPAFVGLLEEYRFYVRDVPTAGTRADTRLARAQFYPGTSAPFNGDAQNLRVDIADNILDLQVALGVDVDDDGQVEEDAANRATDEWFLNIAADTLFDGELFYARISTLARTARPDRDYQAPLLTTVENRTFSTSDPDDPVNGPRQRFFRRRLLQTIVDLRNL
jgi:type II secretory pathway pseudopilin PulG